MAIDRVDRTVVTESPAGAAGQDTVRTDGRRFRIGPAVALLRSVLVVVLVGLAILVLLPAAIAAQAAVAG
jgi:hypothetical protein